MSIQEALWDKEMKPSYSRRARKNITPWPTMQWHQEFIMKAIQTSLKKGHGGTNKGHTQTCLPRSTMGDTYLLAPRDLKDTKLDLPIKRHRSKAKQSPNLPSKRQLDSAHLMANHPMAPKGPGALQSNHMSKRHKGQQKMFNYKDSGKHAEQSSKCGFQRNPRRSFSRVKTQSNY